jgi:catechol 2,3-dioxygenase
MPVPNVWMSKVSRILARLHRGRAEKIHGRRRFGKRYRNEFRSPLRTSASEFADGSPSANCRRSARPPPAPSDARYGSCVSNSIDPRVDIGHVHLKVADIDRALAFYRDVLGFELTTRLGDAAAFVSAGGYHHHIGLNTWESRGGSPPPPGTTGLYHVAIRYPDRATLADAVRRVGGAGVPLDGASDHGVSEALYLRDPDDNGVELYWDRPREEWPRPAGGEGVAMSLAPLDLTGLLSELER